MTSDALDSARDSRRVRLVDRLIASLIGARGTIRRIRFTEAGRTYVSYVPDDSLWVAVKDNLILSEYERTSIRLFEFSGVVVDAGAHVGLFTLRASTYAKYVVALEPHPANYALLEINLSLNERTGVAAFPKALWCSSTGASLADGHHSADSSLVKVGRGSRPVQTITLDDLSRAIGMIDLLKLDIEGAEFEVLQTCADETLQRIGAVVGELHASEEDKIHRLRSRLESAGFAVTLLDPPSRYWRESLCRMIRRWRCVEGLTRVKVVIIGLYTVGALWALVHRKPDRLADLMFLYARRLSADP